VALGTWPTPLVPLPRLGEALGLDLWMKRDECSGLAMGGNKARKLEFVLGAAIAEGARTVVTAGPITSNHTMMTAAAARRLGLHCIVVLGGRAPATATGNLSLTHLYGADVHITPMDTADPSTEDLAAAQQLSARLVAESGGYWIPPGATMPSSVPGYAAAVLEVLDQLGGAWPFDEVVVAYGTGSTSAGVYAGLALAGLPATVRAVAVSSRAAMARFESQSPAALVQAAIDLYGWPSALAEGPARCDWVRPPDEPGYGLRTAGSDDALRRVAREEGYLLDPTYTAKAAAALFAMASDGRLRPGARVLFIHTGGLPSTAAASHQETTS
jgi:1-aminocyclopropane-1-carboxylate deaminase/D-cysteine desulfhydrase-like pyridoxal-dependent ACC family enzyme